VRSQSDTPQFPFLHSVIATDASKHRFVACGGVHARSTLTALHWRLAQCEVGCPHGGPPTATPGVRGQGDGCAAGQLAVPVEWRRANLQKTAIPVWRIHLAQSPWLAGFQLRRDLL
jgi:hypothetical protein